MKKWNLQIAGMFIFAAAFQAGCTLSFNGTSTSEQFGSSSVRPNSDLSRGLLIALNDWNEPVGGKSTIAGSWSCSPKILQKIAEVPEKSMEVKFTSEPPHGRSFEYTTYLGNTRLFQFAQGASAESSEPVEMIWELPTARLLFHGQRSPREAFGQVDIIPDAHFVARGREILDGEPTLGDLLRLGLRQEPLHYIEMVTTNGNRWTWSEVLQLEQRGLTPEFIVSLRKLRDAKSESAQRQNRPPTGARKSFTAEDLVLLHTRGVSVDYVQEVDAAGAMFNASEIVLLHSRGVPAAFVKKTAETGLLADANELTLLWTRGVPGEYIRELSDGGYHFSPNGLVLLHSRGVPASYARELKSAGYNYTPEDLLLLHSRGVPASYAAEIANKDFQQLTATEVVRLYATGVPADTVKRLRK